MLTILRLFKDTGGQYIYRRIIRTVDRGCDELICFVNRYWFNSDFDRCYFPVKRDKENAFMVQ